jgi:NADH-quinone oxidoreductase subunit G
MISIKINGIKFLVKGQTSILEACRNLGLYIPRFCYHETLSVAGNCRMCLVELEGSEKPVASCVAEVEENMSVWIDSPYVQKARENVMETLLINHPLDCPICDQGGECDLQDQAKNFGSDRTRYFFNKRGVEDKECGPLIKTIMTRCIHCTRCVRYGSEVAGLDFLGTLNRGTHTEIGSYISKMFNSEISGNVIDLCPVGALTSKPYAFRARPWELRLNETIDTTDSLGSNIYVNFKETEAFRILPKSNGLLNDSFIDDKTRFSYDSIKNNRIQDIFLKDLKKFKKVDWRKAFDVIDLHLKNKSKINIIINEEVGIETLILLKKLENKHQKKVKVINISRKTSNNNTYFAKSVNSVHEISSSQDVCFLLSSNPKIESSILNAKIRFRFKENTYKIFSFGKSYSYNIPTSFISLNINNLLSVFEGKSKMLSKMLVNSYLPLIVIGESFSKRFNDITLLSEQIKRFFPRSKIINIARFCNTEGFSTIGVKTFNNNLISGDSTNFCINLNDDFYTKRCLNNVAGEIIWINTHGSLLASKSNLIIPMMTNFEEEEIFMNLEGRPQMTQRTFKNFYLAKPLKNILSAIFNFSIEKFNYSYLSYIEELVKTPEKFNDIEVQKFIYKVVLLYSFKKNLSYSKYPFKSITEDFYLSNKFCKNSKIMNDCSRIMRKSATNFPII